MNIFVKIKAFSIPIIASVILSIFLLERLFPLRSQKHLFKNRITVNFGMGLLTYIGSFLIIQPVAKYLFSIENIFKYSILENLNLPFILNLVLGFLILDLSFYYWHRLNHEVKILWRFHLVHHIDPDLDVSTSFRFHFVEVIYSVVLRIFQIVVIGASFKVFIVYELCFQIATFFHHSNLRLPKRMDQTINLIFVTPKMHGVHHSDVKHHTNSNYSVVFSFWDRIHKSYNYKDNTKIKIGVSGYAKEEDFKFISLILIPFKKQKKYWIDN